MHIWVVDIFCAFLRPILPSTLPSFMKSRLALDLARLKSFAYYRAKWAEPALRRYHSIRRTCVLDVESMLRPLYEWMFIPPTLWPFNVQDVLEDCLGAFEKSKRLTARQHLLIDLLPVPPSEDICATVAEHEWKVQSGKYDDLVTTPSKFAQKEASTLANWQLQRDWGRIKTAFKVELYRDHKEVIRRTMATERNLRPWFSVNARKPADVFCAAFDAFCLRWNLYGMQNDDPLVLKLAVNITPFGTLIHIPAYWSFDPKRDIRWDAIASLHRARVPSRQGSVLAEGCKQRAKDAEKLRGLDEEARRLGLKGARKHEFICDGLEWHQATSPRRISRLRVEFRNTQASEKADERVNARKKAQKPQKG